MVNQNSFRSPVVAHMVSNRWNSAVTEYALNAAKAMHQAGIPQIFIALADSPAAVRARAAGLRVVEIKRFSISNLPDVANVLKSEAAGIVFTYGGPETFILKWCQVNNPQLKVIRFRGEDRDGRAASDSWKSRLSQSHVKVLLAPSRYIAERLDSRGKIIEPAVDLSRVSRKLSADPGPGNRYSLTILGRFDPIKGHAQFFDIFARLKHQGNLPYTLNVVGEPANLSIVHLEDITRAAGLVLNQDVFIVAKRVPDISELLTASCAGIVCSIGSEIICRVAQEFLVCGTPLLVSGVGSLGEYVFPGHGLNYGLCEAASLETEMTEFLDRSAHESILLRNERAAAFQGTFGLKALADKLLNLIQGPEIAG